MQEKLENVFQIALGTWESWSFQRAIQENIGCSYVIHFISFYFIKINSFNLIFYFPGNWIWRCSNLQAQLWYSMSHHLHNWFWATTRRGLWREFHQRMFYWIQKNSQWRICGILPYSFNLWGWGSYRVQDCLWIPMWNQVKELLNLVF